MMHPIQCQYLEGTGLSNRLICFCTDSRAVARFLNRADVLDTHGGTVPSDSRRCSNWLPIQTTLNIDGKCAHRIVALIGLHLESFECNPIKLAANCVS